MEPQATPTPKPRKLTRKQARFVDEYIETGNGTQSALSVYDTEDYNTAHVIASENLQKPTVQQAIAERLTPELVDKAHESLLTAVRLDYFVFPKSMDDSEIQEHVEAQGLNVLNIRPTEKGKMAFFSLPDGMSRSKGIELYHKLKGNFAADKHITVNVDIPLTPQALQAAKDFDEYYSKRT